MGDQVMGGRLKSGRRKSFYIGSGADGISLARSDADGRMGIVDEFSAAASSFLSAHPRLPLLYAVNELDQGGLTVFAIEPHGGLRTLGNWATCGGFPCHLALNGRGSMLAVAHYGDGSIGICDLDSAGLPAGGFRLLAHRDGDSVVERQSKSHAHMVWFDDIRGELLAVDLGCDQVLRHDVERGRSAPQPTGISLPPGGGPRHLTRDRRGRCFVVFELGGAVGSYAEHADGSWKKLDEQAASNVGTVNFPSHLVLSHDERFLYVGNRGPDTLSAFEIEDSGRLRFAGEVGTGGGWPRHFALTGDRLYVANQRSDSVTLMIISDGPECPRLTDRVLATSAPTCILPR